MRIVQLFSMMAISIFLISTSQEAHGAVLADVNGRKITLEEFNEKYEQNVKFYRFNVPKKRDALDEWIKRELGVQEAKKRGLDKDPEIQERINTVLYRALLEKSLGKEVEKIDVSNQEAKKYYRENPEIRTSHIFVAAPSDAEEKARKEAYAKIQQIYEKYVRPKQMSFAEVAQKYSEGMAAPTGGDLDYQTKDKLDPEYFKAAMKLKPGQISGIVTTQFGYHIIKLVAVRDWEDADQGKIKRMVFEEKRMALFEKYMDQLRKRAKVQVNYNLIQ